eukprot:6194908-Alexandrium_andersonii.AAC.1
MYAQQQHQHQRQQQLQWKAESVRSACVTECAVTCGLSMWCASNEPWAAGEQSATSATAPKTADQTDPTTRTHIHALTRTRAHPPARAQAP